MQGAADKLINGPCSLPTACAIMHRSKSKLFERHGTDSEEAAAEEGYRRVDASITWTTTRAKRAPRCSTAHVRRERTRTLARSPMRCKAQEWLLVILRIILLGTALQGSVTVLSLSLGLKKRYFALGPLHGKKPFGPAESMVLFCTAEPFLFVHLACLLEAIFSLSSCTWLSCGPFCGAPDVLNAGTCCS